VVEVAAPSVRPLDPVPAVPPATAKVAIMLAREGMADGADATATADLAVPPATADAVVALDLLGPAEEAAADADVAVALGPLGAADDAAATADVAVALGPLGPADEATATADATLAVGLPALGVPALDGVAPTLPTLPTLPAPVGDISLDGLLGAVDAPQPGVGGLVPPTTATVCIGNCDADTGTGGAPPPTQPAPTPPPTDGTGGQDTSTGGISAPDQTGLTGSDGMLAGAAGAAGTAGATFARLRSALGDSGGTLAFTGGAADLLALVALGLLMAGALLLRAARPALAAERR
jgi:hypothetical protein